MRPWLGFIHMAAAALVCTASPIDSSDLERDPTLPGDKVVCYYTNWSQYRPSAGKFTPDNIDVKLCTHIIYAFAKVEGGVLAPFEWNDESTPWMKGMYERVNDLKTKKPSLKTLLSVGGWSLGSGPFSQMVATPASRQRFVNTTVTYLRRWKFDGLDVDWEYPGCRGSPPGDKDRFVKLLQELLEGFKTEAVGSTRSRLLLTASVAAGKDTIDAAYDIPAVSSSVDFLNLMSYDYHGSWDPKTGINSPLYARKGETGLDATLNQNWTVHYWLERGAPREKLVLGVAFYGRSFRLANAANHSVGAPSTGPGSAGSYSCSPGMLTYYEICSDIRGGGWQSVYDCDEKANYAYKDLDWVGYDDVNSLTVKGRYIHSMRLAGVAVWSLDLDDFNGTFCGQGPYPLLTALVNSLTTNNVQAV